MCMRGLLLCALNLGRPLLKQNGWWKLPALGTPNYQRDSLQWLNAHLSADFHTSFATTFQTHHRQWNCSIPFSDF